MRVTRALPTECPACHGLGYTKASQAEMLVKNIAERGEPADYVEVGTVRVDGVPQVGSGCLMCKGLGQV